MPCTRKVLVWSAEFCTVTCGACGRLGQVLGCGRLGQVLGNQKETLVSSLVCITFQCTRVLLPSNHPMLTLYIGCQCRRLCLYCVFLLFSKLDCNKFSGGFCYVI